MTPSKDCPRAGRRQGGGYKGNGASEVSHLPLNRSRTPSAGGGQGQLWKITPLWSPVFGDGSWSADGSGYFLYGWMRKTEREGERQQTKLLCTWKPVFHKLEDVQNVSLKLKRYYMLLQKTVKRAGSVMLTMWASTILKCLSKRFYNVFFNTVTMMNMGHN